jgi:outer membrane autotransporter protein
MQNSRKTGSFDVISWQIGARIGAILTIDDFQFIPSIGVRFITYDQDGWSETINNNNYQLLANRFESRTAHQFDIPVLLKFNTSIDIGSIAIVPELRLGWTYSPRVADDGLRVGFVGSSQNAVIHGIKPSKLSYEAGLGVKLITSSSVDIYFNYDFEGSSTFKNHQFSLGFGYEF